MKKYAIKQCFQGSLWKNLFKNSIKVILLLMMSMGVLCGCKKAIDTEPTLEDTQIVTTYSTRTVRETSLEWRQRMEKVEGLLHHD